MIHHYELCYIVPIKFLDDELKKVEDSVKELLQAQKAEITKEENLGKQKFAYPINHIHQGTYVVLEFDMDGENLKKLDDQLRLKNEVLRHLIIKKRIKTAEEIAREEKMQERQRKEKQEELKQMEEEVKEKVKKSEEEASLSVPKPKEEPQKEEKPTEVEIKEDKKDDKKSTLEDLDKKLDEILTDEIL